MTRAYARVSSARQASEGLSLDAQLERLRAVASDGEFMGYVERGVSGRKTSRPELDRLLADVQPGDVVAVIALDRLGRSLTHVIETVKAIGERGGQLISLRESIDTTTATGRFMFAIVGAFAELESALIGERVKVTRPAALRKHGKALGGRRKYGRNSDGSIREDEAAVLRNVFGQFLAGVPVGTIVAELNREGIPAAGGGRWYKASFPKLLARPDLVNRVQIDEELVEGQLEPIIEETDWLRVQAIYASRKRGPAPQGRKTALPYVADRPLNVTCGSCGGRMRPRTVSRRGRTVTRYICVSRANYGSSACQMPYVSRDAVDHLLVDFFRRGLLDPDNTLDAIERAGRRAIADAHILVTQAEREAMSAEARSARVDRDYRDGSIDADEWRRHRDAITSEQSAAEDEVARLRARLEELQSEEAAVDARRALQTIIDHLQALASRYEADDIDAGLVAALRLAMSAVVEEICIHHPDVPDAVVTRVSPEDGQRSLFLVSADVQVELVARAKAPTAVVLTDGSVGEADLPHFPRVALPLADNGAFASLIASLLAELASGARLT